MKKNSEKKLRCFAKSSQILRRIDLFYNQDNRNVYEQRNGKRTRQCIIHRGYDAVDNSMFFILSSKQRTVLPASSEFAMFVLKGLIGSFPPLKGSRSFKIADLVRGRPWNKTGRQTYDKTCAVLSDTLETKLNVSRLSLPLCLSLSLSIALSLSLSYSDLLIRPRESMAVGGRKSVSR